MLFQILMRITLYIAAVTASSGCSVEPGKIPAKKISPQTAYEKAVQQEVYGLVDDFQQSLSAFSRIETIIKSGLNSSETFPEAMNYQIFTPSTEDDLSFDQDRPERFSYRFHERQAYLKTKIGGQLGITLEGILDQRSSHPKIVDARLNITHATDGEKKIFQIIFQNHTDDSPNTMWMVDFGALSRLSADMNGNEKDAVLATGFLYIKVGEAQTEIVAQDMNFTRNDFIMTFDHCSLTYLKSKKQFIAVQAKVHLTKKQKAVARLSMSQSSLSDGEEPRFEIEFL